MLLSKFFSLAEMTRSDTAARTGIANVPDDTVTDHLKVLCAAVLDPLRESLGQTINVNSGYRSPELNAFIKGAKNSQHVEGKAADIQSSAMPVLELFKAVIRLDLPFDQLIYEAKNRSTKWVHVSHDPARSRHQIMVAQFGADGRASSYLTVSAQAALDLSEPASRSATPIELTYEELPDEPETAIEIPRVERRRRKPAAKKSRPARAARKKKSPPRKRAPGKRKAVKRVARKRARKTRGIRR